MNTLITLFLIFLAIVATGAIVVALILLITSDLSCKMGEEEERLTAEEIDYYNTPNQNE